MRIHSTDHKSNVGRSSCESSGSLAPKSGKSTQGNKVWTASKPGQPKINTAVGINPQPAQPVQQGPVEGGGLKNAVPRRKVAPRAAIRAFNEMQASLHEQKQKKPAQQGSSQAGTDSKDPKAPTEPALPPLWTILNIDEEVRNAFTQPISPETYAAVKNAVAKATGVGRMAKVIGFQPKWFRDDIARLTYKINLLNGRLSMTYKPELHKKEFSKAAGDPRVNFELAMHEEIFNKALDICTAIRDIAGDINTKVPGHPSVALLRNDAEKLEKYLATAHIA